MSSTTNNTMDGDAVGFQDVFNQNTFTIPDFQRNFDRKFREFWKFSHPNIFGAELKKS